MYSLRDKELFQITTLNIVGKNFKNPMNGNIDKLNFDKLKLTSSLHRL